MTQPERMFAPMRWAMVRMRTYLADRQIDPNVRIDCGARRALEDSGGQRDDQEADFRFVQGLQEFTNCM